MKINGLIIVEGKSDANRLNSLFNCATFITNGYDISQEDILFLQEVGKMKHLIVLTDPDEAGLSIRNKLAGISDNLVDIYVNFQECNKHGKHGIAECSKEELEKVLSPYLIEDNSVTALTSKDLYKLGLIGNGSNSKRILVCQHYHIRNTTRKNLLKMLNILEVSLQELKDVINK